MLISIFLDVVCHFLCVTKDLVRLTDLKKSAPEYQVGNELPVKIFLSSVANHMAIFFDPCPQTSLLTKKHTCFQKVLKAKASSVTQPCNAASM